MDQVLHIRSEEYLKDEPASLRSAAVSSEASFCGTSSKPAADEEVLAQISVIWITAGHSRTRRWLLRLHYGKCRIRFFSCAP